MTSPTDLSQLYILLSYEKLQRSTISQRQRPIEASLRNRLLVWRFLKKIENEPVSPILNSEQQLITHTDPNNGSWILDLNETCVNNDDDEIDMDIDSDIVTVVSTNETNNSTCDTMDMEQDTDVTLLLKRAIGAERRQKNSLSTENPILNETNNSNISETTTTTAFEETEQFFHDLCAELTNTTATLVSTSTTNSLRCSTSPEPALIH
ncbi:hypothetical protein I4U23_024201 [Adineta vaga]|nr:hypothetical protein I4U23_024201 [Adineta vaga]